MAQFHALLADYRTWCSHPFTKVLQSISNKELREKSMEFITEGAIIKIDNDTLIKMLAKLNGEQNILKLLADLDSLKEDFIDPNVTWDDAPENSYREVL